MSPVQPSHPRDCETLNGLHLGTLGPKFQTSMGLASLHRVMPAASKMGIYQPTLGHLPTSMLSPTAALQHPGTAFRLWGDDFPSQAIPGR